MILASNFKSNIDDAFVRRFQSIIQFYLPDRKERLLLWEKGFPKKIQLSEDVDLANISSKYELTGASIMNTIQFCCFKALERGDTFIFQEDIIEGIRKEFGKEGRILR